MPANALISPWLLSANRDERELPHPTGLKFTAQPREDQMAWVERHGKKSWRVRYRKDDTTLGSTAGFPTKKAADPHAQTLESGQRQGTWIDPAAGKTTLAPWCTTWLDALDVAANTEAQYRSLLTNTSCPAGVTHPLAEITGIAVAAWAKNNRAVGYASTTVATMVEILSMLLADAADDKLITLNPIGPRRRGRRHHHKTPEHIWATPDQTLHLADNTAALVGPWAAVLLITAAPLGRTRRPATPQHPPQRRPHRHRPPHRRPTRSTAASPSDHPKPPNPPAPSPCPPSSPNSSAITSKTTTTPTSSSPPATTTYAGPTSAAAPCAPPPTATTTTPDPPS
jgi:hypothetical protein